MELEEIVKNTASVVQIGEEEEVAMTPADDHATTGIKVSKDTGYFIQSQSVEARAEEDESFHASSDSNHSSSKNSKVK